MDSPTPLACSLSAAERPAHAAALRVLGGRALVERRVEAELRFRPDEDVRVELERLMAVEAACCPFFDLRVSEEGAQLVLRIGGPAEAADLVRDLAAAFGEPATPSRTRR